MLPLSHPQINLRTPPPHSLKPPQNCETPVALRNANRNRALQQASVIMPPGVIMTYGIRREPVPICARLDYVRTPGVLRDRQSFQRRGPSGGALFGRAGDFRFDVTAFAFASAFAFAFDLSVVAVPR